MGGRRIKKVISGKTKEAEEPVKKSAITEIGRGKESRKKLSPASGTKSAFGGKGRGKKYQAAKAKVAAGGEPRQGREAGKAYPLEAAIKLVKESSYASFDATVEAHINLGLESDKTKYQVRVPVTLPYGTGKKVRILVFAKGKEAQAALDAGADEIGDEATIEKIATTGKAPFNAVAATPEFMPKLAKIARILGPSGLMPSPKSGTVIDKPAEIVAQLKKGRVELKTENQPIIHTVIGKVSFPEKNLVENLKAIVEELNRIRPAKASGEYIKSIYLKSTMGPSVRVDLQSL